MSHLPRKRWVERTLRVLGAFFVSATLLYWLLPFVGPLRDFFGHLPFAVNSSVKVAVMAYLCLYAAGDLARRQDLIAVLILVHVCSVVSTLVFLATANTAGTVPLGAWELSTASVLWSSVTLDSAITLLAVGLMTAAWSVRATPHPPQPLPLLEYRIRAVLILAALLFTVLGVASQLGPWASKAGPFALPVIRLTADLRMVELPFVGMSVVKYLTLAILCLYIAGNLYDRLSLLTIVWVAHLLSAVFGASMLLVADACPVAVFGGTLVPGQLCAEPPLGLVITVRDLLWGQVVIDGLGGLLFWELTTTGLRRRLQLRFFSPMPFHALQAAAEVLIQAPAGTDEIVTHSRIAQNTEAYLRGVRAKRLRFQQWALNLLQLHPLLYFKAPLSEMDPELRRAHLEQHFARAGADRRRRGVAGWLQRLPLVRDVAEFERRVRQVLIRVARQLALIGYYGDAKTWPAINYQPFSRRPANGRVGGEPPPEPFVLDVDTTPEGVVERQQRAGSREELVETDVCIIGSGAAGSILAHRFTAMGRYVLLLERGQYVEPRRPAPGHDYGFTEDEVQMVGRLYADGVFEQSDDWRFTVLQGSCVGGTTVVNNAVCFDPPAKILQRWNEPALNAGLDVAGVTDSVARIRSLLSIGSQATAPLNPSGRKFEQGAAALDLHRSFDVAPVEANIKACLGCGYCNIGCAYGRKLSMLDRVLPEAQQTGRLRIIAECEVERILFRTGEPERVIALRALLRDRQKPDGRRITIRARTFIVSAGAVASSFLLLQSRVGRGRLPVGRRVSFNMGSAITAEFDEVLNSHQGLQISHYAVPRDDRGYVLETWWNPPVVQALNMPGWFEEHWANMHRYDRLMGIGVLVGTEANASVGRALIGGPEIFYRPTRADLKKLAAGLTQAAQIAFAGGARRLMLSTWGYRTPGRTCDQFTSPNELSAIAELAGDPSYVLLGTGHPQGGNAISMDARRGVVDRNFRVHGFDNLFVCDASVFPTSVTVNPQVTVMALAHYAADLINQASPGPV